MKKKKEESKAKKCFGEAAAKVAISIRNLVKLALRPGKMQ